MSCVSFNSSRNSCLLYFIKVLVCDDKKKKKNKESVPLQAAWEFIRDCTQIGKKTTIPPVLHADAESSPPRNPWGAPVLLSSERRAPGVVSWVLSSYFHDYQSRWGLRVGIWFLRMFYLIPKTLLLTKHVLSFEGARIYHSIFVELLLRACLVLSIEKPAVIRTDQCPCLRGVCVLEECGGFGDCLGHSIWN